MALSLTRFIKGLILSEENDSTKKFNLSINPSATTGTTTTLQASQTANRILTLPDETGTLVGPTNTATLTNKTIDADLNPLSNIPLTALKTVLADANKLLARDGSGAVVSTAVTLPSSAIVGVSDIQTLTNKTIDGDNNTVQDLALSSLKTVLADANKTLTRDGSGAVVSTAITYPSGTIVGTTDNQTLTNKTIDGDNNTVQDLALASLKTVLADASKFLVRDASGIVVSNTKAVPSGDVVGTSDAQVLTNKDIDGGTASNTHRITLPKAILATLTGLTRKEATLVYATDTQDVYIDDGVSLTALGGGGGTPTGDPNTLAYFDSLGDLNDNTDAKFISSNNAMSFGSTTSGAGALTASSTGSLVHGRSDTGGAVVASGEGSHAHGVATSSGSDVTASGVGSNAHGLAEDGSSIFADTGSTAFGYTSGNSAALITAANNGSFAHGRAQFGAISATGQGATAFGNTVNATSAITASGAGSVAGGKAETTGLITASGIGSMAFGRSTSSADPHTASGHASVAFGESVVNAVYACLANGRFAAISGTATAWVATDPLFVLGIGASTGSEENALAVHKNGDIKLFRTITTAGTTGAQTINKPAGSVNFAIATSSLVVTNSLVNVDSIVICSVQTADATAVMKNVVPTAGSFTITLNAATTAETRVSFLVIN